MTREKFSNWIWSGFFTVKKLSFWLQTSLSEPNFWLAPLWGQLGMAYPLRLTGVKSADFYPPNSRFWYFFWFFWLGCLEILVLSMPINLEAISVQKSLKMPLWNFWTLFDCNGFQGFIKMFLKPVWVGKIHGVEVYATHVVRIWWFSNKFSIFQLKRM